MIALLLLASTCSVFMEDWSYMKSMVYNFHNYWLWRLHSPRLVCKEDRSWRDSRLSGGLSLVSCILGCLVDSVENVKNFSDRCTKFLQNSPVESDQAMILKPVITELNLN
ncbi:hypothetical protein P5673_015930 [Acropora cervicornis]|uniref:Uncharacterized protein n=1 Tax=Acropora cervicornis TaxID=6130 RepID=A0AAD9V5F2_ACRCE|nr:hypothetical protein P5673_015930 [Acropora cervicornis]